jgi:hypothetical protein
MPAIPRFLVPCLCLTAFSLANTEVVRVEVSERSDVATTGYEQIVGRLYFEIDVPAQAGKMRISPRKWDCPPDAARRGQVHVFGPAFVGRMRPSAEKWTSPQPARERLPVMVITSKACRPA